MWLLTARHACKLAGKLPWLPQEGTPVCKHWHASCKCAHVPRLVQNMATVVMCAHACNAHAAGHHAVHMHGACLHWSTVSMHHSRRSDNFRHHDDDVAAVTVAKVAVTNVHARHLRHAHNGTGSHTVYEKCRVCFRAASWSHRGSCYKPPHPQLPSCTLPLSEEAALDATAYIQNK